jgi:putative FmdB family regulatory protein
MPLYEYRCEACGQREEKLESMSAPEAHDCPKCSAAAGMKRQVSVSAFTLAGGGWYKSTAAEPSPAAAPSPSPSGHGCASGACGCPFAS